jgi:hypothetical protein
MHQIKNHIEKRLTGVAPVICSSLWLFSPTPRQGFCNKNIAKIPEMPELFKIKS